MKNLNIKQALANATVLQRSGDIQGAFELYQQITQAAPKTTEAWYRLGQMSAELQRFELAESFYLKALEWDKRNPDYYNGLGEARMGQSDYAGAKQAFDKALKRKPSSIRTLNNIAQLQQRQEKYKAAEDTYSKALRIAPKNTSLLLNLSSLQIDTEQFEQAIATINKALLIEPDNCLLRYNLARIYADSNQAERALQSGSDVLESCSSHEVIPFVHIILGNANKALLRLDQAEEHYMKAITLKPDQVEPHTSLGLVRLISGKLNEGWPELAWVIHKNPYFAQFRQPVWHGEPLEGMTLSYIAEQGLGDEIMFANLYSDIIRQAGECLIECDERLIPLFTRSYPEAKFFPRQKPPRRELLDSDYICWGSSAAAQLRSNLAQFPQHKGYLTPAPEKIERWQAWLNELDNNRKVGICWRSMVKSANRGGYPDITEDWDNLLKTDGLTFINLQYGDCAEELEAVKEKFGITIHMPPIDLKNDLDEIAALIAAINLVISSATALAQLSGAVGQETIILTDKNNWSKLGSDYFPWYPSFQGVYRVPGKGWKNSLDELAVKLQQ